MMKIKVIAVGKVKEKYFVDACNEYLKRLTRYASVTVTEVKEENFVTEPTESEIEQILKKEGASIIKELKGEVFVMAIEGKKYSSVEFSRLIKKSRDGVGEMSIVIGGSYGVANEVKKLASGLISFSDMTFPHTLARVMTLEQLYRGFNILSDGRYHK
ncbi:MAG: 23S rRNA (pseudouridine(1915)-N(3))-methyltransferase RlmH [Clostridia bacterium]|nr:23S rRNA (pseudouridine(1915)-N(3))-methyltransferase RlmH [Clostridia bacterium]